MDVTRLLLRAGAARPHVLVAAMPGGASVRLAAEDQLARCGWPAALSPADADVLLVAGTPAGDIAAAVEAAWAAVPAPRARAHAARAGEVAAALDTAHTELARGVPGRLPADGAARGGHGGGADGYGPGTRHNGGHGEHGMVAGHSAMGGSQHSREMAGMDMPAGMGGSHHGHDMGGMEMPAGLPMARRGEDRDGLKLDQLHVPFGPILPDWPAGLVIRFLLQGDVVQHAEAEAVGVAAASGSFWDEPWRQAAAGEAVAMNVAARRRAAAHLDSLARFLGVAGWGDAAGVARGLRDGTLGGRPGSVLGPAVRRFASRVARSRVLAWSTRGMGMLRPGDAAAAGVGEPALRAGGDVTARYRRWCSELADVTVFLDDSSSLDLAVLEPPRGRLDSGQAPSAALLGVLPSLLEGAELAAARLILASLDPDLDELGARVGARHGP